MKTKYITLAAITAGMLLFGSCKKIKDLLTFKMKYNQEFTIPGAVSTENPIIVSTPYITTNSEETFKNYKTSSKHIREVHLTSVILTVTAPDSGTYDFLDFIEIYISTDSNPEILLASKHNIPPNPGSELSLDVTGADLKEYVKAERFKLRVAMRADQTTFQSYDNNAEMTFSVRASPL